MCHFIESHLRLFRIITRILSLLSSVVDADGRPDFSSTVTLAWNFLNVVIHSYKLHCNKALFPYTAEYLRWISASDTPSAHKNRITERCFFCAHGERSRHVNSAMTTLQLGDHGRKRSKLLHIHVVRSCLYLHKKIEQCNQHNKL